MSNFAEELGACDVWDEERGDRLYEVLRFVRPLTLASARVVEAALQERGITVGMRAVMEVLERGGPATVPGIARDLELARQGVQRLVNELVGRGHAETLPNPRHRTSPLIALTPQGVAAFTEVRTEERSHLARMASGCTDAEIEAAVKVLSALHDDVRRRVHELDGDEETS